MSRLDCERELRGEIDELKGTYPKLHDDELFVHWFLRAYLTEEDESAAKALVGGSHDKGIDAILIDDEVRKVFIVQGKYRKALGGTSEKRTDVVAFSKIASIINGGGSERQAFMQALDPLVRQKLETAIDRVRKRKYEAQLFYVTTGRVTDSVVTEAYDVVQDTGNSIQFDVVQAQDIVALYNDYLIGAAPPVPYSSLPIGPNGKIREEGVIRRFDPTSGIESWVFSADGRDVGNLFREAGRRLFARNIRGYLGRTEINDSIAETLRKEPENFWYYNNGITIVCDEARQVREHGRDVFRIKHPQIINGQQTTRVLADAAKAGAGVLVRVIRIPREPGVDTAEFDSMVTNIVRAANWQNKITLSDLMSNDSKQVWLERELKRLGYQYIRKRQTKGEARASGGSRIYYQVKKEEMAQAVAACELDPAVVREGKERLFDEQYYPTIFGPSRVMFYLPRYWMMRQVQSVTWGRPEWAYPKWVVLHHVWNLLPFKTDGQARRFVEACEEDTEATLQLYWAIELAFRAVIRYFRLTRGRGEEAKDVSTFFQRRRVHDEFAKFWRGTRNPFRSRYRARVDRFLHALGGVETS